MRARCLALVLLAIASSSSTGVRLVAAQAPAATVPEMLGRLTFRNVGPAVMGGRINDVAVYEANPAVFYVATATGALWKTTNNAVTWTVLFDEEPDVVSIGAIAIARDNPDDVWVGTGEANNRQSSSWGNGVYRSRDGGRTWRHLGLASSRHIARIVVDRTNPQTAYVAAVGSLWRSGPERGIFKTTDGGATWKNTLYVDDDTGATDLVVDPGDPRVLYAATYQRRRAVWGFNGGGPGSGIHKSTDGGETWTRLTAGLPAGPMGRIGLDVYAKNPQHVYALVEHEQESGLFRSENGGASWSRVSRTNPRPMYFSQVRVDPGDESRIYVAGVGLEISDDGGRTFTSHYGMHVDHHALWINPRNTAHVINGNDGGVAVSYDRGAHWASIGNMDLGQFYHVGFDMDTPYRVFGGLQDNMAWGGPSATRSRLGIPNGAWFQTGEYDGMVSTADPGDSRRIYVEAPGGRLLVVDRQTNERKTITPDAPGTPRARANWNAPFLVSRHDPATLLAGGDRVYRSTDRGHSWAAISPDVTSAVDRDTLSLMGVAGRDIRLSKNDGVSAYPTLTALAESPSTRGVYYAGADDGSVHVTKDGGGAWTNLNGRFPGLPAGVPVSALAASASSPGTAYIAFDAHMSDDFRPYVYKTADYGASWRSVASTLPAGHVARSLAEDPKNPDVLYLGTEFGLFVSLDAGGRWDRLKSNLPTVPVFDIAVHPRENDLILATHGRSIWILDDLTPIQHAAEAMKRSTFLYDPRPATEFKLAEDQQYWGEQRFWGQNPAFGAGLSYYLQSPAQSVEIRIANATGDVVRRLTDAEIGDRKRAGINRVHWDLRYTPHPSPLIPVSPVSRLFTGSGVDGPFVPPGQYTVTLMVDGKESGSRAVAVRGDPLIPLSDADRTSFQQTALLLYDMHAAALRIDDALRRLTGAAAGVQAKLTGIQAQYAPAGRGAAGIRARIGTLESQVNAATSAPTEAQQRAAEQLHQELSALIDSLNAIIRSDAPAMAPVSGVPSRRTR